MNSVFYKMLSEVSADINSSKINKKVINNLLDAYSRIVNLNNIARMEGLLSLDDESKKLDLRDDNQNLLFELIQLIIDGTDNNIVKEIGLNKCITLNKKGCDALINLMYYKGCIMIQAGDCPWVIERYLKSMMPKAALNVLDIRELENQIDEESTFKEEIERLCKDDKPIDKNDSSPVNQTAYALTLLTDNDVQTLLRYTITSDLSVAMKALPGAARKRIFDNVSLRTANMIAEKMIYMGPVRLKDVEDSCSIIMKTITELNERGEFEKLDLMNYLQMDS